MGPLLVPWVLDTVIVPVPVTDKPLALNCTDAVDTPVHGSYCAFTVASVTHISDTCSEAAGGGTKGMTDSETGKTSGKKGKKGSSTSTPQNPQ